MEQTEKRFSARHNTDFTAYIMWDGRLIEARAINISNSGILLATKSLTCPTNTAVSLCCIVARQYHDIPGHIVHIENGKIAIAFNQTQPKFFQKIIIRDFQSALLKPAHTNAA